MNPRRTETQITIIYKEAMFSLNAVVNGGKIIRAEGSQNFPKHYRNFTDGLYEMLNS